MIPFHRTRFQAALFAAVLLLGGGLSSGQDPRGAITGTVTDATDALVPGAALRAVHAETGVAASAVSNAAGNYQILFLQPGMYRVTAELAGFKRFVRENIEVRVGETVGLPVRMEIGDIADTVEVVETTPLLDTTGASLGQVIDQRRIAELPQRGANPMELALLAPGVFNATDMRMRTAKHPNSVSQFAADGGRAYTNEFQIDGITNVSTDAGVGSVRIAFSPPASAVREFKIQTTAYDASLGRTLGAVVNVTTASGTNELHAEVHYALRHSALDAPNFFNNKRGTAQGLYQHHRYGGSAGGPLVVPRLYDGRNRSFWFYAFEENRPNTPNLYTQTVPTAGQRQGDFSDLLRVGASYQIYDPFTIAPAAGGRFSRQPIPGNVIPRNRLDPLGLNLVTFFPLPNQPGTADGRNNFFYAGQERHIIYQHLLRLDHAFSENHRAFLRLHYDFWKERRGDSFGNGINLNRSYRPNRGFAVDDVAVLSPSLVLNVRYGLSSTKWWHFRSTRGYDLARLGFSPALLSLLDLREAPIPRVTFGAYSTLSSWIDTGDGVNSSLTHSLASNLTKLLGRHSIRFGADFRVNRSFNNRRPGGVAPLLEFGTTYTRGPLDNSPAAQVGQDLASMLMGIPGGSMSINASSALQDWFLGFYAQDDLKLTRKLTLNLGLRYEYENPLTERYDRLVSHFDFDVANPIEAQARAQYATRPIPELPLEQFRVRGGLNWVKQGGMGRSPFRGEKNNVLPRLGLAYQLGRNTILRSGYGLYYDTIGVQKIQPVQTGYTQSTPIQASLDSGLTYRASTTNPFPAGLIRPLGPLGGLTTSLGQGITSPNYLRKHAYSQRWSFGLQRTLPARFVFDGSYVASRGTRLEVDRALNVTPARYLSTSPVRDQATIDFLSASFPNPFRGTDPIFGANIARSALLRPYPHFGGVSMAEPIGYTWYHSLQTRTEKRFSQGYTFQLNYTFSKRMDAMEFLNDTDVRLYESIGSLDRPHRVTASGVWELPFGRKRKFGAKWPAAADFVLGGWQLGSVVTRQSGAPLGFGNIIFNGDIKNIPLPKSQRDVDRWFNVDAGFNRISSQQLASNIRRFPLRFSGIRGDNQNSWDFSIVKNFQLGERLKVNFRGDVYNAWNQTNFAGPNMAPANTAFGAITATAGDSRNWQLSLKVQY